ncbi:hypothetical protein BDD12DRAFT_886464 [Trichophaea hybrida]|nr:hypothetical protein BDD12DRAFT_886464 [Trichophaea hybrida]
MTKSMFGTVETKIQDAEEKVLRAQLYYDSCNAVYQSALEQAQPHKHLHHYPPSQTPSAESEAYASLNSTKQEKKQKLQTMRIFRDQAVSKVEAHLAADEMASEAVVKFWETQAIEASGGEQEIAVEGRELDEYKQQQSLRVEQFQYQARNL